MGTLRPNMFIASSSEGLECAEACASQFKSDYAVDIWTDEDVFKLNTGYLQTLLNRASYSDFAVAVFTTDDLAVIRDKTARVPRDNVIFEFGLFLGRLGLDRAFFIMEKGVELFSDWSGIKSAKFSRDSLDVDIPAACKKIRTAMKESAEREQFSVLPSTSLAVGYYHNFLLKILEVLGKMDTIEMIERDSKGRETGRRRTCDISNQRPIIHVKVPLNLVDLMSDKWKDDIGSYTLITVPTPSRPYPFYIEGDFAKEGEPVELFDVPTTLLASRLAIQEIFDKTFLTSANRQALETREISNFKTTLELMIKENGQQKFLKVSDWNPHDS
jgi:hypothetical protein